jgi:hypothetical protein
MAAIPTFNPGGHKPTDRTIPNSPPEGYPAVICDGATKDVANTPGAKRTELIFEITEGEHRGRKVFHNLNLVHPNPETVKFAQDDLYYICQACGVTTEVGDTEQLKRLPLRIVTKLKERKPRPGFPATGELQTVIVEFRRRDGSSVKKPADHSAANQPTANGKPFWEK